jgi:hypothetical protein
MLLDPDTLSGLLNTLQTLNDNIYSSVLSSPFAFPLIAHVMSLVM